MILVRQIASRLLFAGLLFLMVVEAIPPATEFHRRLDAAIDPFVDVTGLWQFPWDLFAPEVDKIQSRVSATFHYADGTTATWESPRWAGVSPAAKFSHFREIAFYDRIRRSANSELWPAYVRYLARQEGLREGGEAPVKVELWRHTTLILPPGSAAGELADEQLQLLRREQMEESS